ncbi:MAG: glycosyltransferase family 2 protein [Rhodococcus sp. (in: high G+C Gram-positive bacteria)]|uniref:glycosyltransferase family 2 protein n=1 Tax=Rhodococcus sp. TaxID=1831 RepID=UPI00121DA47B|nr:glycosyltransferase family 2 protein [Rhodococcus sp. (in: high G+C Gram-positive bacteria)]RZL22690.1 MAG: glycosyltransferase family 2 protein [Rhodococcus sp. (in: high G+C Gram-positive bacteria)]
MKYNVVIVNYFTSDYVQQCLATLDSKLCNSIVIVDNSSDQTELEKLRRVSRPFNAIVVEASSNLGFGAGVNLGVAKLELTSATDTIWVLNPDTKIQMYADAALLREMQKGNYEILSPVITCGDTAESIWFQGGSLDKQTGRVTHWNYLQPYRSTEETYTTQFMCGAAPMFTQSAWQALGGFNESLFMYWEDAELSWRAHDARIKMGICGSSAIWHAVGGSSGESGESRLFYLMSARNRLLMLRTYNGLLPLLKPRTMIETIKFALRPLRREKTKRFQKFAAGLTGIYQGITKETLRKN